MSGGYWRCSEPRTATRTSNTCARKAEYLVAYEGKKHPICSRHIGKYMGDFKITRLKGRQEIPE